MVGRRRRRSCAQKNSNESSVWTNNSTGCVRTLSDSRNGAGADDNKTVMSRSDVEVMEWVAALPPNHAARASENRSRTSRSAVLTASWVTIRSCS
jgi:hypothetical protein